MAERWCEARHTATHCVDSPRFPQQFVTLVPTIWCSGRCQGNWRRHRGSFSEFLILKSDFVSKLNKNREMQLDWKALNTNDDEVRWEQTKFCFFYLASEIYLCPFLSGLFLIVWSRCWKKVTLTSVKQIGQIFACWFKNRAVILSCVSFSYGYLWFETKHSGVFKEGCSSSEHYLTFPSPLLGWGCCSVPPQAGVHREGGGWRVEGVCSQSIVCSPPDCFTLIIKCLSISQGGSARIDDGEWLILSALQSCCPALR